MSNVNVIKSKGHIVLYKDWAMFGKIIKKSVLFLSDGNKFIKMESKLISRLLGPKNQLDQSDFDTFLFEASKSILAEKAIDNRLNWFLMVFYYINVWRIFFCFVAIAIWF